MLFVFLDKTAQSQATFYARGLRSGYGDNAYSAGDRLVYQTPLLNPGSLYNVTSGEYFCHTTGVYLFIYSVHGHNLKPNSCVTASLYRDGQHVSKVYFLNKAEHTTYVTLSHTDIVACSLGQKVWIQVDNAINSIKSFLEQNIFGGVLLYST